MTPETIKAARALLEAHDAWKAADAKQPECDEGGYPYDGGAWLEWHSDVYRPASRRLWQAHEALERALGTDVPRHPAQFRPLCEALLRIGAPSV